ncbi:hypothetical protein RSK60_2260002 [Ralstonia solanacearum K60]|nr:hypothetical protein RSK60_2260002 [Ralstonia solanacearum K60]
MALVEVVGLQFLEVNGGVEAGARRRPQGFAMRAQGPRELAPDGRYADLFLGAAGAAQAEEFGNQLGAGEALLAGHLRYALSWTATA